MSENDAVDAARYRWLRSAILRKPLPVPTFNPHSYGAIFCGPAPIDGPTLDEMIDEGRANDDGQTCTHDAPKLNARKGVPSRETPTP